MITEFNDIASVEQAFAEQGDVAAVILEPIPHNVGTMRPTQEYLEALRRITRREGALLIFDEVITGFRHALGGYQQIAGVLPDLTAFGKAVGNGFPVSGLAGPSDVMCGFNSAGGDVLLAGTFSGHPGGLGAALATIERLEETDFYSRVYALGERMRNGLRRMATEFGIAAHVEGFGSVFVLYFLTGEVSGYRDLMRNDDRAYIEFHRRMTNRGFLMLPLALKRNHISGSHTAADVDRTLEAAEEVLTEMLKDGVASEGEAPTSAFPEVSYLTRLGRPAFVLQGRGVSCCPGHERSACSISCIGATSSSIPASTPPPSSPPLVARVRKARHCSTSSE